MKYFILGKTATQNITYVKFSTWDLNFSATFCATLNPSIVDKKSSIFFLL